MDRLWKSKIIGSSTKVKIFNCNMKVVFIYASDVKHRLHVFINK